MKKVLLGFLCIGLLFCTSVSFASDGPETTKDCVIDNLDVMETFVVVGEVVNEFDSEFKEAEKAFSKEFDSVIKEFSTSINVVCFAELRDTRQVIIIYDYGVKNSNNFLNTNKQIKPISKSYTHPDNDNMIRKL